MNIRITNTMDWSVPYAKIADGETRPGLLKPGEVVKGHAVTYNTAKKTMTLFDRDTRYVFRLEDELFHMIVQ